MSLIGDSKEEDREIFAAMKAHTRLRRQKRVLASEAHLEKVKSLVDGGTFRVDPNGTWNWKLKGRAGQFWPTKGRWQYTSKKLIDAAKSKAAKRKQSEYHYYTSETQFGGGILKFIHWLERQQ